jgi:hypothetical protein
MHKVKVVSSDENEALLERVDGEAPGQYVLSRYRLKFSVEGFVREYPVGKQFEIELTKIPIRVYAVDTSEPDFMRFQTGLSDGLGDLYFDRKAAQEEADALHDEFPDDEEPPWVVELDVL